jgi:hypothetical protein
MRLLQLGYCSRGLLRARGAYGFSRRKIKLGHYRQSSTLKTLCGPDAVGGLEHVLPRQFDNALSDELRQLGGPIRQTQVPFFSALCRRPSEPGLWAGT